MRTSATRLPINDLSIECLAYATQSHSSTRIDPLMHNRTVVAAAAFAAVVGGMCAAPAHAQFRNQGVQLPNAGWLGLGSWDAVLNRGPAHQGLSDLGNDAVEPGWNLVDEPTLGTGYFFAVGYNLWVDTELAVGA